MKRTFETDLEQHFVEAVPGMDSLTRSDISHLPQPVQDYLLYCGFVGHQKITNARVVWAQSHIRMKPGGGWMKLKTIQYNTVDPLFRIAYMKARLMGVIPFEGRDMYWAGQGHMLGKIANIIKVFDEKEPEIAQSALVIILAESLLVPGYALSPHIEWEEVDHGSARATLCHKGVEASGVFFFNEAGEMVRFESAQRYYMDPEKGNVIRPFVALVGDYKKQGLLTIPGSLTAIWQLEQGEYQYWKGTIERVDYNIAKDGL